MSCCWWTWLIVCWSALWIQCFVSYCLTFWPVLINPIWRQVCWNVGMRFLKAKWCGMNCQAEITVLYLALFSLLSYWLCTLINLWVYLCTSTPVVSSWQLVLFPFIIIKCHVLQLPKASSHSWAQNVIIQQMCLMFCVAHAEVLDFNESQSLKRVQAHLESTHSDVQASVRTNEGKGDT